MKRLISLLIVCLLTLPAMAADQPADWAAAEIDRSLLTTFTAQFGVPDYARAITREEFCVLALSAYRRINAEEFSLDSVQNPFSDVQNPLILVAYGLGLVRGVSETEFAPTRPVSRQELCVMLSRVTDLAAVKDGQLSAFLDSDTVADWAVEAMSAAVTAKLLRGDDTGRLRPMDECSVEEALVLVSRVMATA